jgi:hypothetical protein
MPSYRKNKLLRPDTSPPIPVKQAWMQDVIWGRHVFKAPALPNPRTIFDPLPFTATRITYPQVEPAKS